MHRIIVPLIVTLLVTLGVGSAAAQVAPRAGTGSADHNTTGRSVIPEKIGKPLQRGFKSRDVKLRLDDGSALPSAPHARPRPRAK
jgi:hypothetical protein